MEPLWSNGLAVFLFRCLVRPVDFLSIYGWGERVWRAGSRRFRSLETFSVRADDWARRTYGGPISYLATDAYVLAFLLAEGALAVTACASAFSAGAAAAVVAIAILRILEITWVLVRVYFVHALRPTQPNTVLSIYRSMLLAFLNYIELVLCFGLIYACNSHLISTHRALDALYLSGVTQLTIGYGDITPLGWLRAVIVAQATIGVVFGILVFGRLVASLDRMTVERPEDRRSMAAE